MLLSHTCSNAAYNELEPNSIVAGEGQVNWCGSIREKSVGCNTKIDEKERGFFSHKHLSEHVA